jgi:hypothetical protein
VLVAGVAAVAMVSVDELGSVEASAVDGQL